MDLEALLRAHAFLKVERPPELWTPAADDVALIRLLGEMIAATLVRGNALHEVVLGVSNVTVEEDPDPGEPPSIPAPGDYVAMSVRGRGECGIPMRWSPASPAVLVGEDLDRAARAAAVPFAYTQDVGGEGSVTVFFPRAP
jgi:hypothetical protein